MVNKVKRFVVFVLFSFIFQLIHVKVAEEASEEQKFNIRAGVSSAEAKCCPPESTGLDSYGNCY